MLILERRIIYNILLIDIIRTMKTTIKITTLTVMWISIFVVKGQNVQSPDTKIEATFHLEDGKPLVSLRKNEHQVLKPSPIGLRLNNLKWGPFNIVETKTTSENEIWEPVWDKHSKVTSQYNQTTFWLESVGKLQYRLGITLRVYNDAMAIRYEIPEQEAFQNFTIDEDLTSFNFPKDHTFWSANGENHNLGPAALSQYASTVGGTGNNRKSTAREITKTGHTPIVLKLGEVGYMAILEAAIYDFAYFDIRQGDEAFSLHCHMKPSSGITPAKTSWRVVLLGDLSGDLVESNTLVNLNPSCAIKDPSWIEPGKAMWDWRVWGYEGYDGFKYGLNTESHKRLIDFAAENNIRYLLMDADWYGPEFSPDADPTSANNQIDIEENMAYAKSKGVGIILYLNDVGAKKFGLEKILRQFSEWGAAGIKYGFMTSVGQEKVLYTRKVVELCAKYKLTVNFHDGPVPPSGDRRTWPNLVTREYGHSQADAKKSYYPETVVNQVLINMITGPLDLCNLWFGFEGAESRDRVFEKIPGTVAAEVAKLAAIFSGIHIIPDAPEEYNSKYDLFEFVKTLPDSFDELRILEGHLDEYVTVARRKGEDWYVGSLTNRDAREVLLDLSFLNEGSVYQASIYADADDSHYLHNQETYQVTESLVKKGDVLNVRMAPGGGHAIRLINLSKN